MIGSVPLLSSTSPLSAEPGTADTSEGVRCVVEVEISVVDFNSSFATGASIDTGRGGPGIGVEVEFQPT